MESPTYNLQLDSHFPIASLIAHSNTLPTSTDRCTNLAHVLVYAPVAAPEVEAQEVPRHCLHLLTQLLQGSTPPEVTLGEEKGEERGGNKGGEKGGEGQRGCGTWLYPHSSGLHSLCVHFRPSRPPQ